MARCIKAVLLIFLMAYNLDAQNMTVYRAKSSVAATTSLLEQTIKEKGLRFFETVDHDKIAKERGATISPTAIILFEDPDLSSELIQCEQTSALDLPLKIMIWEEEGDVYIGYFDPILMRRKFLIDGCDETLKKMSGMVSRVVNECLKNS
jgi:uncharacterized protein (DUF302 family)